MRKKGVLFYLGRVPSNFFFATEIFHRWVGTPRKIIHLPLVNIFVSIAPNVYGLFVTVGKKGKKQLFQFLTALWHHMVASLLYCVCVCFWPPVTTGLL